MQSKILLLHAKTVHGAKQSLCKMEHPWYCTRLAEEVRVGAIHCGSVLGELTLYSCALLIQNSCMQLHPGTNLIMPLLHGTHLISFLLHLLLMIALY